MSAVHRAWLDGQASRPCIDAPEMRGVDEPAITRKTTTGTGIVIGGAVSRLSPAPYAGRGPYRRPAAWRRAAAWALRHIGSMRSLMVLVALAMVALLLTACSGPTEIEAAQAVAAQVDDARIDEWVQVAQRANPNLTAEDLSRVRAAAMFLEHARKPNDEGAK